MDNTIAMIITPTNMTEQQIMMASTSPPLRELVTESINTGYWELNMINCVPLEFMVLVEAVVAFPFPCVGTEGATLRYNNNIILVLNIMSHN